MALRSRRIKAARSEACGRYHREVTHNEVFAYLVCDDRQHWLSRWSGPYALEVHHIFGRGTEDHERRTNLVKVSACDHGWGHDRCPNEFRLACLYAKWQKSLQGWDSGEFDVPTLAKLVGVPLADWFEVQGERVQGAYRGYAEEIARWLRSTK